jgi:exonuclease III
VIVNALICDLKGVNKPQGGYPTGGEVKILAKSVFISLIFHISAFGVCLKNKNNDRVDGYKKNICGHLTNKWISNFKSKVRRVLNGEKQDVDDDEGSSISKISDFITVKLINSLKNLIRLKSSNLSNNKQTSTTKSVHAPKSETNQCKKEVENHGDQCLNENSENIIINNNNNNHNVTNSVTISTIAESKNKIHTAKKLPHYCARKLNGIVSDGNQVIILSVKMIIALIIALLLLSQTIEPNPGPPDRCHKSFKVVTYNCNGLGNTNKLRRILLKSSKIVDNYGIVCLQETHIVNTDYLKLIWKNNFISNCISTNSAGVIILYHKELKLTYKHEDAEGRLIVAAIEDEDRKIIISNSYFPNDHKEGTKFAEKLYLQILETQVNHPEHITICAGDYNVCMTNKDLLNRQSTKSEQLLAANLSENNKLAKLLDAYRVKHSEDGFTWQRGNCYSRLDYIYTSEDIKPRIKSASTNWSFDKSDHAAVVVEILEETQIEKGPGIVKINTRLLEDPKITNELNLEIDEMMKQCDEGWNPHTKLEFLKVAIRSAFSAKTSETRKAINDEIKECEEELNQMENLKIKIVTSKVQNNNTQEERENTINRANQSLKEKLDNLRNKLGDTINFITKAKWFEYGERSNKFFLSLNKSRQKQKMIHNISDNTVQFKGQKEVSRGITNFYGKLYEKTRRTHVEDNFYENCPKLTNKQAEVLEKELTLKELKDALNTCKESAPGPDGIPYLVYKKLWSVTGPTILESWNHSLRVGKMPPSHLQSVITLLPKEGKDKNDIKNWRPITLSNCDSKIITKALSIKTSKILDSIIDTSQTAYIPGRSVADNLRANYFYKNHCRKNNVDAALISLDAKKAFDSVDHKYIEETLIAYGFGEKFVNVFKTLYNDLTAKILINGYMSEAIKIERGVKQGDALSCAIFIICIDPLLRNLNKNARIKQVQLSRRNVQINFKSAAYADDISVICQKNIESIQQVFVEYEKLTERSGLELNADKTEILLLNSKVTETFNINYKNESINIRTVNRIKICGLYFCADMNEEYNLNVREKITKLEHKIKLWSHRHLTMEGKTLIVKTFGLSQLIYNMQSYVFEKPDLANTERIIFKFLWSTKDNPNGIDRIKRSVMKNEYMKGGMRVTDVDCLNRSLKLKQFIRAADANHAISRIQKMVTLHDRPQQEYFKLTEEEDICKSAQETINIVTDGNREEYTKISQDQYETDRNLIEEVASINIKTYLKRKKKEFHLCMLNELTGMDIITLGDLSQSIEFENDRRKTKTMNMILQIFPKTLQNISKCYNDDLNTNLQELKTLQTYDNNRKDIRSISVKEFQITLKTLMKKIEDQDFNKRLGIEDFDNNNITKFRKNVQNAKLRNIYFRLINNDFFTRERMFKYKMISDNKCTRCGNVEDTRHLLFECEQVKNIWKLFNSLLTKIKQDCSKVEQYRDIFNTMNHPVINLVKIKIIQSLIQIIRPSNWTENNIINIIKETRNIEKYNSIKNRTVNQFEQKWNILKDLDQTLWQPA